MPAGGIPTPCGHLPDFVFVAGCDLPGAVKDVAGTAVATAQFMNDPFGYIAEKMQAAAAQLTSTVLPNLEAVTHPDLDRAWFLDTYRISFALALFVFVAFVGWNFVELSRRRISGDDLLETLGFYVPLFLGGALLGPMLGQFLLSFTGALTNSVAAWGVGGSATEVTARLQEVIAGGDPATITGGAFVAILFFFALIIGLLLAFAVLVVMLVTLYLTGAILPLSLVWLVHPHRRGRGLKIVSVWLGICFSHVLLFLLLGAAFKMVAEFTTLTPAGTATAAGPGGAGPAVTGAGTAGGDGTGAPPSLQALVNLAVAVIALFMATLAPFGLLRFAPVGPTSGGSGPSMRPRGSRGGRPIGGHPESATDSQMSQAARSNAGVVGGGPDGESGEGGGGKNGWGLQPRGDGLTERYAAERQARAGGGGTDTPSADSGGTGSPIGASGGSPGAISAPGLGPVGGGAPGAAGGGAGAGGGSAGGASAGGGATAGGGSAAAGAAAGAAGLGLAALDGAAKAAGAAGDMAADHMDHGDGHDGLHPRHT